MPTGHSEKYSFRQKIWWSNLQQTTPPQLILLIDFNIQDSVLINCFQKGHLSEQGNAAC